MKESPVNRKRNPEILALLTPSLTIPARKESRVTGLV